jgi:hypothetical protein
LLGAVVGGIVASLEGRLDGAAVGILMTGSLRGLVGVDLLVGTVVDSLEGRLDVTVGILMRGTLRGLVGDAVGNLLADELA